MCTHTHTHTRTHIYTHSCATSCKVISLVPRWAPPHQAQVRSNETCTCGKIPFRPAYVKRDCMCEKRRVFSHIQVSFDIVGVIPPSPSMLTEVSLHLFWQVLLTGLLQVSCTGLFSRIHVSGRPANPVYVNRDCVWKQTCFSIYTGLFWHCMRHPTEPVYPQMSNETSIPVSTYASLSSIVRHVCLYVYKTGMSVLVQDRYVCLYVYKTSMSVCTYTRQICLSLPIQDKYVCLYVYKTDMSVSTYTRQVCLSLRIQDRYVCLYLYKTGMSVSTYTSPLTYCILAKVVRALLFERSFSTYASFVWHVVENTSFFWHVWAWQTRSGNTWAPWPARPCRPTIHIINKCATLWYVENSYISFAGRLVSFAGR